MELNPQPSTLSLSALTNQPTIWRTRTFMHGRLGARGKNFSKFFANFFFQKNFFSKNFFQKNFFVSNNSFFFQKKQFFLNFIFKNFFLKRLFVSKNASIFLGRFAYSYFHVVIWKLIKCSTHVTRHSNNLVIVNFTVAFLMILHAAFFLIVVCYLGFLAAIFDTKIVQWL